MTAHLNTNTPVIEMNGTKNTSILDNILHCNQPTLNTYDVVSANAAKPPVPKIDGLMISQNRVRGRCKSLLFATHSENAPNDAFSITENQTKGLTNGVEFEHTPLVKPRISDNLFEGTDPANFVKGPVGFTFDGSNGPQP